MSTRPSAIEASDVSLAYKLDRNRVSTFKEFVITAFKGQIDRETLWALSDVSFHVSPGEIFGVVGPNGAGKSTLMKVIARVLPPSGGRIVVRGNVAAMIALGAGFNPDMTARENIQLYGTLLGREAKAMRDRVDAIIEWAELEDFVDVPTRSFSSGMLARLAFSVATDSNADILVVDEVLAVGDQAFRQKSLDRIDTLITNGAAVVIVSHELDMVRKRCERVMWLDHGRIVMLGDPDEVITAYEESAASRHSG